MNVASPYWYPFENGRTIGMRGTEGGTILADEQHDDGARITLERDCLRAPVAITVTVYGWGFHTRFLADEATGKQAYDAMKADLVDVLELLPKEEDEAPADVEAVDNALAAYMAKFP